jgi:hypothetical protein
MSRRLDLVRRGLGRQPRLGLRQLSLLRLPKPPSAGPRVRREFGDRDRGLQSRRLLGPLLQRTSLVPSRELLDASAAAPSAPTTAGPAESAGATDSTAPAWAADRSAVVGQTQPSGQWKRPDATGDPAEFQTFVGSAAARLGLSDDAPRARPDPKRHPLGAPTDL